MKHDFNIDLNNLNIQKSIQLDLINKFKQKIDNFKA